jgi:hypothetical protein
METKKIKTHLLDMENSTSVGEIFPDLTVTVFQVFPFFIQLIQRVFIKSLQLNDL